MLQENLYVQARWCDAEVLQGEVLQEKLDIHVYSIRVQRHGVKLSKCCRGEVL